jgi:geranylgeranyl reductase family protein
MTNPPIHDVAIVGAGPSGSSCAWYLARHGTRVLLLEKAKFPRDKFCGDAVVPIAQRHLERMGVLQQLIENDECVFTVSGGFISPSGISCMGDSTDNPRGRVMAVKRIIMDERMVRAAQAAGAELVEEAEIDRVTYDDAAGVWTAHADGKEFKARVLVLADGAHSRLARSLGLVTEPPSAICSRAFVEGGTHDFKRDGVCYMTRDLLPGYAAVFRHPHDELNFCTYIIPGGKAVPSDLKQLHHDLLDHNPFVRRHLGSGYRIEKMRGAWLRLGGIPKSYGEHLLVIGDAAGHIDPLTGEGIHNAMDAGQAAADTLMEAFAEGRFDEAFLARYQQRWKRMFGSKFPIAARAAQLMGRRPELVDAMAMVTQERGMDFFLAWADVMTGEAAWTTFLRPRIAVPMAVEVVRQLWARQPMLPGSARMQERLGLR